ncbi:hypothetical protein [Subtercola sp. RTI3]|uniref:hypothetical protein n=1 Tax=Subtercola sp. RTI3 TaxID=3048639 RepID=UPI002B23ECEF|nr:hypothetical protein [Subtercola sp. RTI3]MEA9983669.1 hypothetical protein [Subtercola sp. RTI3]
MIVPSSWLEADALWCALWALADDYAVEWGVERPERDVTASPLDGFNPEANIEAVWFVTEMLVKYVQASVPDVFSRVQGAIRAVQYVSAMQTALARYPSDDAPQKAHFVRCRACKQMTLRRRPPLEYQDPIVVECTNEECGELWDPRLVDFDLKILRTSIVEAAAERARAVKERVRAESRARIKAAKAVVRAAEKAADALAEEASTNEERRNA